jgi:hypothetical protein
VNLFRPWDATVGIWTATRATRCCFSLSPNATCRFNRARYNADQTVTAFAARLQGEVDIGTVRADLLGTVNRTLEPVQLSLWLSAGPDADVRAGSAEIMADGAADPGAFDQ